MNAPTIAEYLKFANLQMAAEALFGFNAVLDPNRHPGATTNSSEISASQLERMLTDGNLHASKFTTTEAKKFAADWEIVEHKSNTTTGFSGTLFRRLRDDPVTGAKAGELVMSFRSTEFIDDAARDNEATNKLEIADKGWAFGQLSDMEAWYAELKASGKLNDASGQLAHFAVTGYSLGGHLASAFNLMHPGVAKEVVTFNGAGIGQIGDGSLTDTYVKLPQMVARFQELRAQAAVSDVRGKFTTSEGLGAYRAIKAAIFTNGGVPTAAMDSMIPCSDWENLSATAKEELDLLGDALADAAKVAAVAVRALSLLSGLDTDGTTTTPKLVDAAGIAKNSRQRRWAVNDVQRSAA